MRGTSTLARSVVTGVALLCALAVGLALGGGPLDDPTSPTGATEDAPAAGATGRDTFGDAFATATATRLYDDALAGRQVAMLTLPGAGEDTATALTEQVEAAGGAVTARYAVAAPMVDAAEKSLVDSLGAQLDAQLPDRAVGGRAPTYVRMGQLLGRAVATENGAPTPVDGVATTVRSSLVGADLLAAPEGEPALAPFVILLLPEDATDALDPAILTGLVRGLADRATGVVVAGDLGSGADGDLAALRTEAVAADITTVDGVDTAVGRVAAVLALAGRVEGRGGAFGASGSDGAVPLG